MAIEAMLCRDANYSIDINRYTHKFNIKPSYHLEYILAL